MNSSPEHPNLAASTPGETAQSPSESQATPKIPHTATATTTTHTIADLRSNNALWYKLHDFIYDLRNLSSNDASRDRIDTIVASNYIGMPYFTEHESEILLNTTTNPLTGETLRAAVDSFLSQVVAQRLQNDGVMSKKNDYRVCTNHDIAPIFEQAFGVRAKELGKDEKFVKMLRKKGLEAVGEGEVEGGKGVWKAFDKG
jgi:hypothetical protein